MATILAANTGNWSATSTWTGGVVPVAGDIVVANNRTITVNQNVTVAELRNDTTGSATVGGQFQLTNGVVVNANVIQGATTTACVLWAGSAGQTVTLTGAFTGGSSSGASAVSVTTAGSMVCQSGSSTTGGTGNAAHGIAWGSTGSLTFTGTASGGNTGGNNQGINFGGSGSSLTFNGTINGGGSNGGNGVSFSGTAQSYNITATVTGASTSAIVVASASSNGTITGTCTGGTVANSYGVSITSMATCSITGDCYSGSGTSSFGIQQNSTGTLTLTGNIFGHGTQATTHALSNDGSGATNVSGTATAGNASNGARNNSTGILRITRAVGNGFGLGSVGMSSAVGVNSAAQGSLTYVEQIQFGALGQSPVSGPIRLAALTTNQAIFTTTTGTTKTLVDTAATSGVLPAATDVRTGVVYSSGNLTGTCAVPAAGSVALGVPVDNTTGTAVLTAANARTALGLASANLDTQLAAIPTTPAPSVTAIRTELDTNSAKLANLDATVSSRSTYAGGDTSGTTTLLSRLTALRAGYLDNISTAPPTASDIATAVWAAATRTLTTAIDNSATIAAAVWSYATGRTITGGTVDTLTNAPTVPSAAAIASQVRTELTTELGRIDASVSSRLAASGYTTPPTAAANATAVRTELATELGRIDAAVSSRLAPSGTLSRVTLTDTTTTLTNAPNVPSASTIASQVRTELTPELARMANAATVDTTGQQIQDAVTN